jgi:hypothetical protein
MAVNGEAFITPLSNAFVVNEGHNARGAGKDTIVTRVCKTVGGVTSRHVRHGDC